ncbi:WD40 repeat-like protein [Polychaeton citri CBS 116435]|uniref:non-specific serine/threonine protein kinase n=1 Tax=Polychaeton citri CBS 116435 TaxID=1314669 RepID=A0A9P4Q670_9PEZI|nr:WD40 repeat-like protein [Polychaeton citri CBS 116435]
MTQVLALVKVVSPVNSFLFTQYIFPRLQIFVNSPGFRNNGVVRATYAACLAILAQTAEHFLDMMQALRAEGSLPSSNRIIDEEVDSVQISSDTYDATHREILDQFEAQTKVFLTDQDNAVRRAFLTSVPSLCVFFGESKAGEILLSHLNTYLNDPDWLLKCGFFRTIVGVAVFMGGANLEDFILPLMTQALADTQEFVVEQALRSLSSIAEVGLLQRQKTWELIDTVAPFQMHPNLWIREAAAKFTSAATKYLSTSDIRILVAPLIEPYLKVPIPTISEVELLDALKKPIPRAVLDLSLQWASDSNVDKGLFWKQARESLNLIYKGARNFPPASSVKDFGSKSLAKLPKTEEDERWLGRLRNAGMRPDDEMKILAFRQVLWRTAQRTKRAEESDVDVAALDNIINLAQIHVTPQTVLFDNHVETYEEHMRGDDHERTIAEALMEATKPNRTSNNKTANAEQVGDVAPSHPKSEEAPQISRRLSVGLRRQTSGSLSSSPSSGLGLLGKNQLARQRDGNGLLLPGFDAKKSLADAVVDDAAAAGKLDTPLTNSRRTSPRPSSSQQQRQQLQRENSHRLVHSYTGNDPTVLKLLDTVYVDNFPVDAADFGPLIQPNKRGPIHNSNSDIQKTKLWRPQCKLVAVLGEHTARVTRIAAAPDHTFFITASDDGSVKVWDSARLERNVVHKSRQTYRHASGVKVTSLCFVTSTRTFVSTGTDGSVHVVKVGLTEPNDPAKTIVYSRPQAAREWTIPSASSGPEYAVWSQHFRADSVSTLVLATNSNRIIGLDMRFMSILFEFRTPAQHGKINCFCVSRKHEWLLTGTSNGVLDLWDLRFKVRLRSWTFPNAVPIVRLQIHPSRKSSKRNRVIVSGGTARGEITVWDIEKLICHEIYRPALSSSVKESVKIRERKYTLTNIDDDRPEGLLGRVAGASAADPNSSEPFLSNSSLSMPFIVGQQQASADSDVQTEFILTGGPDGKVRYWDCERLDGCRLVSGPGSMAEKPEYTISPLASAPRDCKIIAEHFPSPPTPPEPQHVVQSNKVSANGSTKRSTSGRLTSRYETIKLSAQHMIDGHLDVITDVALLEKPFGMVLSADRSGRIFVYQ